jgi:hypothetical protein
VIVLDADAADHVAHSTMSLETVVSRVTGADVIGPTSVYVVADVRKLCVYFAIGDHVPDPPVAAQTT